MITIKDEILDPDLPNWEIFRKLTEKSSNDILQVAHKTISTRIGFASMHLSILRRAENNLMKRAMFEDMIINLVSSLEAIGHVLNAFYNFGIEYRRVTIDHKFPNNEKKHKEQFESCLRCRLKIVNYPLADFLDKALKTGSPAEHWYQALVEYRHQILHRQHLIGKQIPEVRGYLLPDDPEIITPTEKPYIDKKTKRTVYANYTKMREIKRYTEFLYENIVELVELIYMLILANEEGEKAQNISLI
jgi:hypothetical protein